ncbi:MAG: DUF4198 domain-containing protein [Burkholderiales bacterium]|jgi:uncharacterized GH25 family protein|nr:DUF4198 domain-containing protein [Burkholderiales bacterium]
MKKKVFLLCSVLLLSFSAQAHRAWMLPSATVFSGKEPWLTVDAVIGNELFYFDHVPMQLTGLTITAPDGTTIQPENSAKGRLRSVFDVPLKQSGTYRLTVLNQGLFASYEENGETKRWRGTADSFAQAGIADKKALKVLEMMSRIETFVTSGKPDTRTLSATKQGLALQPITHPNDLAVNEAAVFQFLLDGKPLSDLSVSIILGGTRYRDKTEEQILTTDKEGKINIRWTSAGMYFLETDYKDDQTSIKEAKERRLSYSATFEVLP